MPVFEHVEQPVVQPQIWRAAVWGGRWRTEQAKRHALVMAERCWGIRILKTHHHTAEAIWIGLYALGELRAREQQQGLPGLT
jgi:hypothetical protein